MDEFTHERTRPEGRTVRVQALGNNAADLELAALDKAREFFGEDVRLEIVNDYHASSAASHPKANGERYVAEIIVRALNR